MACALPQLSYTRAHDYSHLIRRWRKVAPTRGLRLEQYCEADGFPLFVLETRKMRQDAPWIYISAGIHGDECASTEGLLAWASDDAGQIERVNLLIFPCLNPWGLMNNSRYAADGRDLNRTYHDDLVPQTAAHKEVLAGRRFDLALTMHEDFDAQGVYVYEVQNKPPNWGERIVAAATRHLPVDLRKTIEGSSSRLGIIRRRVRPSLMPHHPEAFTLHFEHADRTFTIETPSEFHLDTRVAAQVAAIREAIRICLTA